MGCKKSKLYGETVRVKQVCHICVLMIAYVLDSSIFSVDINRFHFYQIDLGYNMQINVRIVVCQLLKKKK